MRIPPGFYRYIAILGMLILLFCLLIWGLGSSPILVIQTIFKSTWQSQTGLMSICTKASLLILTGLAVALPYRAGLFNIGGEGQLLMGALAAAVIGALPLAFLGPFHLIICLGSGMLIGAMWAAIAGFLKTKRGVHEVISTIMLNYVAFQIVNELALNLLSANPGASHTAYIQETAKMPTLFSLASVHTSWAIICSIMIAIGLSIMLYQLMIGFKIRVVGSHESVAQYSGISTTKIHMMSLMTGGALAGLAGAFQTTAVNFTFFASFGGSYGFDGIAVAFLALCEPWGTIPAAMVIATLRTADRALQIDAGIPKEIVFVLEGMMIIVLAIIMRRKQNA